MTINRVELKKAIFALLDSVGHEHPLGHQQSKAARFIVEAEGGHPVEVMFEKNHGVPANIWCAVAVGRHVVDVPYSLSPQSGLWLIKTGKKDYGRHSALEKMPMLGDADLVKFQPVTLEQAGRVIDGLLKFSLMASV